MSRAAWAGLLLVGAGCGLVVFLLTRGLPGHVKTEAELVPVRIESSRAKLAAARKAIDATVAKDRAYLKSRPEVVSALATIEQRAKALDALDARYGAEVGGLLEADRYADRGKVVTRTFELETEAVRLGTEADRLALPIQRVLHYKTHHRELVERAQSQFRSISVLTDDPTLPARVQAATAECPSAKAGLDKRLAGLNAAASQVQAGNAALAQLTTRPPIDYVKSGKQAEAIVTSANTVRAEHKALLDDLNSLAYSSDRILVDMREKNGLAAHKYKDIKNGKATTTDWIPVSLATYQAHREHLGMALKSKPECVPASEASTAAAPPGYAYVGNPRYGQWEQRNGQSFWVFYGRYALMRDLLWGPSYYRPISRGSYRSYRSSASRGSAWFGPKREYGTSGSRTRTRYANSSFIKTEKAKKFRSSSYKGSSSSSRSSYRGSSYSGRSSRSGSSYRSSGYRSSSFGGSGK